MARVEEQLQSSPLEFSPPESASLPSSEEVLDLLVSFTDALDSLLRNARSVEATSEMVEVQRNIIAMQGACEARQQLRPSVTLQQALSRSLQSASKLWPTYARALTAPNLSEAQKISKAGQALLDSAVAEIDAHKNLVETTRAYEDLSITDFLDRIIAALSISHPEHSLMELGRIGALKAAELTQVPTDEAHGAQYTLLHTIASIHLDPQRFSSLIAESAQFCMSAQNLTTIAQEDRALTSIAASTRMLYEALGSFEAILTRETNEDALLRRIIKFHAEVYEDVAGPLFTWYNLLAGTKQQPYAKLAQQDVTDLARSMLRGNATSTFLENSGSELRNAANHGSSLSVSGEIVTFHLRSYQGQRTRWEILDEVFSLLESLSAMSWSLSNALTQRGYPIPLSDEDAAYMRITPFRLVSVTVEN
ncbi:hypothetical protein [Arthrobacter sp. AET 35A]|uniref:hypothetical protein n=1 Tax=Arthrobacter sp. AET 35A TaxID=2292643 RepID=UPI001784EFAC|nr:hypothetical protein [Arthrobacter sp. AET 35A]